ncbi:hypothetical protein BTJ40_09615 [Microbulbifer sp. A4B17]|nr:hypothetical protein BTJ40_09615 [Microbulbifer sp. A4B17]
MFNFFTIVVFSFPVTILISHLKLSDLIKYQFERHHEKWLRDGSPMALFFKPRGSSSYAFHAVCNRLARGERPDWIFGDPYAEILFGKVNFWDEFSKYHTILFAISIFLFLW